jgi:hypothetical protein
LAAAPWMLLPFLAIVRLFVAHVPSGSSNQTDWPFVGLPGRVIVKGPEVVFAAMRSNILAL